MDRKVVDEQIGRLKPWQIEAIKEALTEADRGEFASEEEVEAMFEKFTR